ncbi:MAG: nuclear transport factor 2 family protein [Deltaproteobacteria bacterium]|nr:nuclear transport factor 2 family protein [Deltaproteobacteria bacterium]
MVDHAERARRRALVTAHYAAENAHDAERIMQTFSPDGVMRYNAHTFSDPDSIRQAHGYIGMTADPGAFDGLVTHIDQEHFSDNEIVIEGRLTGRHRAFFEGYAATGREVVLPFVAFYRFDAGGKLVNERVVMNLGPLGES